MIDPCATVASSADAGSANLADQVSLRLVDPGPQPLEVFDVLTRMGCPSQLAADYVGVAAGDSQPEVLVGARAADAARVAEALRAAGAAVSVGPSTTPAPRSSGPAAEASDEVPARASGQSQAGPHRAHRSAATFDGRRAPSGLLEVDTVERYIAAYNTADRAGLVSCLSATAVLSDATGQVLVHGAQAIGRRMADVFEHYPDRQVTVLGRLIARPWVLDHQRTIFGGSSEETVLCFRVEGGLIERLVVLR
jgi:hypothetical protein